MGGDPGGASGWAVADTTDELSGLEGFELQFNFGGEPERLGDGELFVIFEGFFEFNIFPGDVGLEHEDGGGVGFVGLDESGGDIEVGELTL